MLSNAAYSAADIGLHLLDGKRTLQQFRKEISLSEELLERYTGRYEFAPGVLLTVTREGPRLFAQLTGQPRFEVFAESERECFLTVVEARVVFLTESEGKAVRLTLLQNGREQTANRID